MKNFSITTALVSLLALYGADAFSAEVTTKNDQKQKSVTITTKSESKKGDVNVKGSKESTTKKELKVTSKSSPDKKQVEVKHVAASKAPRPVVQEDLMRRGPRITVGGELTAYMWGESDEEAFDVAPGASGGVKGNVGDYRQTWGAETDAVLRIRAENKNSSLGITYGADVQVGVPAVKGELVSPKAAANRGAKAFVNTAYGDVSLGYQQGVEASMRLDASTVAAGDGSNIWTKHVNLEGHDGSNPFYLSPVLFSESLTNLSNPLAFNGTAGGRDYVNSLPFRLSYQSPNFMGAKLGLSYSPTGYKEDLFVGGTPATVGGGDVKVKIKADVPVTGGKTKADQPLSGIIPKTPLDNNGATDAINLATNGRLPATEIDGAKIAANTEFDASITGGTGGTPATKELAGKYEHLISAALVYDYDYNDIKLKAAVTGEYGKSVKVADLKIQYNGYNELNDLVAGAIGVSADWRGVKAAGSFGWLGKSGVAKATYAWNGTKYNETKISDSDQKNTYYLTAGAGYEFEGAYASVTYLYSNKNDGNILHDVGVGVEYNLALGPRSKNQYKVFGNYHYFKTDQKAVKPTGLTDHNKGSVFLAGLKFEF